MNNRHSEVLKGQHRGQGLCPIFVNLSRLDSSYKDNLDQVSVCICPHIKFGEMHCISKIDFSIVFFLRVYDAHLLFRKKRIN